MSPIFILLFLSSSIERYTAPNGAFVLTKPRNVQQECDMTAALQYSGTDSAR